MIKQGCFKTNSHSSDFVLDPGATVIANYKDSIAPYLQSWKHVRVSAS